MQAALAESVQTCTLLVTGRLEEVLDPAQKAAKYPAVQPEQLISILYKFRYEYNVCCYRSRLLEYASTVLTHLQHIKAVASLLLLIPCHLQASSYKCGVYMVQGNW